MSISFSCPTCKTTLQAPKEYAGRPARCKHCGATVRLPQPATAGGDIPPAPSPLPPRDQTHVLAVAVAGVNHRSAERHPVLRFSFTHSGMGRVLATAALVLFLLAILASLFTFWQIDWKELRSMPFDLAVSLLALTLVPGLSLTLLGLFTLATAHILEYLARIATRLP